MLLLNMSAIADLHIRLRGVTPLPATKTTRMSGFLSINTMDTCTFNPAKPVITLFLVI